MTAIGSAQMMSAESLLYLAAPFFFCHIMSNFSTLKTLTLLVHTGLFWCFHKDGCVAIKNMAVVHF